MKRNLILIATSLFLMACDPFHGAVKVSKTFAVNTKSGQVQIPRGEHGMSVSPGRGKAKVQIRPNGGAKVDFTVNIPNLKQRDFRIAAGSSGQNFAVVGKVRTEERDGGSFAEFRDCVADVINIPCMGEPDCDGTSEIPGRQMVSGFETYTREILTLSFQSAQGASLGSFRGVGKESRYETITSTGDCN